MRNLLFGLILVLISLSVFAGNVSVTGAWLRLLPGDLPLAGYARVVNTGKHAVVLEGASSPEFSSVQMHRSVTRSGMDTMVPVGPMRIGPGKNIDFAPGGYHLMLMGRKHPLHIGEQVPITLEFSDNTHLMVEFVVRGATGQ
ncbi:MAG: copper chaperone PCu(A)C [Gammaproteobacteria bacterium]